MANKNSWLSPLLPLFPTLTIKAAESFKAQNNACKQSLMIGKFIDKSSTAVYIETSHNLKNTITWVDPW